jgi:hypothetical protein
MIRKIAWYTGAKGELGVISPDEQRCQRPFVMHEGWVYTLIPEWRMAEAEQHTRALVQVGEVREAQPTHHVMYGQELDTSGKYALSLLCTSRSGSVVLLVEGLRTIQRYDVCEDAAYTMCREEEYFHQRWPRGFCHAEYIEIPEE